MTRLAFPIAILLFASSNAHATIPAHLWSRSFGSTTGDAVYAVAMDASGNVYATGIFQLTINLGGTDLVSAGSTDIFLVKYSASGAHLWSKRFGSASTDEGLALAVDATGSVFVTGDFSGTVDFGGAGLVSAGATDIFLAKYNANGTHQWSQRFGGATGESGFALAVDGSGNLYATGYFTGTVNFGGVALVSAGSDDAFLAKYNSGGTHQWSQRFGSTSADQGRGLGTNSFGEVYLGGFFNGTVNFGGGGLISAGGNDIILAKYNTNGVHLWSSRYGSAGGDIAYGLAVDAAGNVVATGVFQGTVDFGGGNRVSAGGSDVFLAKYNNNGVHQWSQRFGGTGDDNGQSVATDAAGSVSLTGYFFGTAAFGGSNFVSAGSFDIFLSHYDANGTHQWSGRLGGIETDNGRGVDVDESGKVIAGGWFRGATDFGGGNLTSAGTEDGYVVKYSALFPPPDITSIADIGNDQGGKVKIRFARSGGDDATASNPVTAYEAYRRDDPAPSAAAWRDPVGLSQRELLDNGWTQAGTVSAHAMPTYGIDVPTIGDSTLVAGQYYSVFFVRAATTQPSVFFDSPIDSGYSVDNLAPGVPQNLVYNSGQLSWHESSAADFDYFTVYGSNTNNFGAATLVDYSAAPALNVTASPYTYYFVTATDFSGNEGNPATINTLTGIGETPQRYVLSVSNYPNPFNPRTTVSYTVPSRGEVTIAIYDARGARVATLVRNEAHDAGAYRLDWNGRTDAGAAVSSGIYFARIEHNGAARSKKMVMLK